MNKKIIYYTKDGRYEIDEDDEDKMSYELLCNLHRKDGPAIIYPDGEYEWHIHGILHREGGPAVSQPNGNETWFIHGKIHREDGPAVIFLDGRNFWWLYGNTYKFDEYLKENNNIKDKVLFKLIWG